MKFSMAIAATALLLGSVFAASDARADLKEILDKKVIRIGTQMDNPPFGYLDAQGKPTGFDIELGEMIGKALGVKVEVEQIIGANRIPYLLTNKIDKTCYLKADSRARYERVVEVVDSLRSAGVDQLGLLTESVQKTEEKPKA